MWKLSFLHKVWYTVFGITTKIVLLDIFSCFTYTFGCTLKQVLFWDIKWYCTEFFIFSRASFQLSVGGHVVNLSCGAEFNFLFVDSGNLWLWSTPEILYSFMFFFILLGQKGCVEIDVTRGAWRDVACGEFRPFICKKNMGEWSSVVTGMQLLLECL